MGFAAPGPSESTGWHRAKRASRDRTHSDECWRWHQECAEQLIEYQQVAIKRVREVCRDPSRRMMATSHMNVEWVDLNAVLNALEGDSEQ